MTVNPDAVTHGVGSTSEPSRNRRVFALIVASGLASGAIGGILWAFLAPAEKLLVVAAGRGSALTGESLHRFDSLAILVSITAVLGVLMPAAWWCRKPFRGVVMFAGLLLGSVIGAAAAAGVGLAVAGLRFPKETNPVVGQVVSLAPGIASPLVLLVQPLITSLVVVLLAALNPHDDLRQSPADDVEEHQFTTEPPTFDSRASNSEV